MEVLSTTACNTILRDGNTIIKQYHPDTWYWIAEIDILMKLDHPNIIKPLQVQEKEDHILLYLPYYTPFNPREYQYKHILFKLLLACAYLEEHKIIHRDIKCDNILIYEGDPILIDFDLAVYDHDQELIFDVQTLPYRSPEVLQKKKYNSKIDIWSLGCIFYFMVVGCHPFKTTNEAGLRYLHQHFSLDAVQPLLDDTSFDLLSRMLEFDPDKRYSASQALAHSLFNVILLHQPKVQQDKEIPPQLQSLFSHFNMDKTALLVVHRYLKDDQDHLTCAALLIIASILTDIIVEEEELVQYYGEFTLEQLQAKVINIYLISNTS